MTGVTFSQVEGPGPDQGGGAGSSIPTIARSATGFTSVDLTVTPGDSRAFMFFHFTRDTDGSDPAPPIDSVTIDGQVFLAATYRSSFEVTAGIGFQRCELWFIPELDFTTPLDPFDNPVITAQHVSVGVGDFAAMFCVQINNFSSGSSTTGLPGALGSFAWPVGVVNEGQLLILFRAAGTISTPLDVTNITNIELIPAEVFGANSQMRALTPVGPFPFVQGTSTLGALAGFITNVVIS